MTETAATDSRPKFIVEPVDAFRARVPSFQASAHYTQLTLPALMNAADGSMPGYEFTGVIPVHRGVWLSYRRIDQLVGKEAAPDANAGISEILHKGDVHTHAPGAAPQVLGYYKGGEPAHFGDVVRGNGGADMTVICHANSVRLQLFCEWIREGLVATDAFNPGDLVLIRRAPVPAVPAEPTQDSVYVCNVGGVAVPFGLRGARQAEAAAIAALSESVRRASRADQPAPTDPEAASFTMELDSTMSAAGVDSIRATATAPWPTIDASSAPKVTPADVEAAIASEHYYTGAHGLNGDLQEARDRGIFINAVIPPALAGVMHCTLTCKNGQLVTGEAFCADLDSPDHEAARKSARRRAFDKLYDMVVYEARERLSMESRA